MEHKNLENMMMDRLVHRRRQTLIITRFCLGVNQATYRKVVSKIASPSKKNTCLSFEWLGTRRVFLILETLQAIKLKCKPGNYKTGLPKYFLFYLFISLPLGIIISK
jgi:hypothetical protein